MSLYYEFVLYECTIPLFIILHYYSIILHIQTVAICVTQFCLCYISCGFFGTNPDPIQIIDICQEMIWFKKWKMDNKEIWNCRKIQDTANCQSVYLINKKLIIDGVCKANNTDKKITWGSENPDMNTCVEKSFSMEGTKNSWHWTPCHIQSWGIWIYLQQKQLWG